MIDVGDLVSNMLNGLLQLILDFVIFVVNLILIPFDSLIESFFPDLSSALSSISSAFAVSLQYIGWIIDSVGLESITVILIVDYFIFKLTIPLQAYVVKIAVSWYNHLKT